MPFWDAHPICSFLCCCETGLSVYQSFNAPNSDVHLHSRLPLVCDPRFRPPHVDYVNVLNDIQHHFFRALGLLNPPSSVFVLRRVQPKFFFTTTTTHRHSAYIPMRFCLSAFSVEKVLSEQYTSCDKLPMQRAKLVEAHECFSSNKTCYRASQQEHGHTKALASPGLQQSHSLVRRFPCSFQQRASISFFVSEEAGHNFL
jgi:hypothetical protein